MSLRLDWCGHEAAEYAVKHWHYSHRMPAGKAVRIGVWEDGRFIGSVIFSRGANVNIGVPFGLSQLEVCELTRVALAHHRSHVSRIVAISVRLLRQCCPGLRLLVSYADPTQGHNGAIYQAMGWTYAGLAVQSGGYEYLVRGQWMHLRTVTARFGTRSAAVVESQLPFTDKRRQPRKHKYLMPLDDDTCRLIAPLAQPYPKRPTGVESDTTAHQAVERGARPTVGLHKDHARIIPSTARL